MAKTEKTHFAFKTLGDCIMIVPSSSDTSQLIRICEFILAEERISGKIRELFGHGVKFGDMIVNTCPTNHIVANSLWPTIIKARKRRVLSGRLRDSAKVPLRCHQDWSR
jgi:hypothetical protein